jgi:ribonuclease PH
MEYQIKLYLENSISLDEYPNSQIKIFSIIMIDEGSVFILN